MQIYSKSMKNAASPLFRNHNRSALEVGTYMYASRNLLFTCFSCSSESAGNHQKTPSDLSGIVWNDIL